MIVPRSPSPPGKSAFVPQITDEEPLAPPRLFPAGREGPRVPCRDPPPFSFAGGKRKRPRPVKRKPLGRKGGPKGPPFRVTGVVRIGPAGVGGPAVPAPDPSREELHPRITALGGRTGRKTELAYFYSRAFRSATRCPGGRGELFTAGTGPAAEADGMENQIGAILLPRVPLRCALPRRSQ